MLVDHRLWQERWAAAKRKRSEAAGAFGDFLANLASWNWFCTFTFRDQGPALRPPARDSALDRLREYFSLLAKVASDQFGYALAEEFGRVDGRWHCHALVAGVHHLERRFWWREGYRRFGRTRIEPCNSSLAASHYAAKYEAKQLGEIHFEGNLGDVNLPERFLLTALPSAGLFASRGRDFRSACGHGSPLLPSAGLPREFFHSGLSKWHR